MLYGGAAEAAGTTAAPRASTPKLRRRADIQGLWALAVCLVVADHAGVPWLRGGFVGVGVFFVVSGFLISSLLLNDAAARGRVHSSLFHARRAGNKLLWRSEEHTSEPQARVAI